MISTNPQLYQMLPCTLYMVQLSCLIPCTHEDAVAAGGTVQQQTSYYSVLIIVLQCVGG